MICRRDMLSSRIHGGHHVHETLTGTSVPPRPAKSGPCQRCGDAGFTIAYVRSRRGRYEVHACECLKPDVDRRWSSEPPYYQMMRDRIRRIQRQREVLLSE